jgi:hypothetical protein
MPSTVFDVENNFATITRFVTEAVMKQLMHVTGIEGAEIIYNEPLGYGKNAAANSRPDAPALKLDAKDYLIVTYNERFDGQAIDPLAHQEEHNYVFLHSKLGIRLRPITSRANIEFSLTYRSKSYNKLSVWLSRFQRNKVVREPHNYHSLMYNYTLPDVLGAYVYDVYHLSEAVEPYGLTMKEYFARHFTQGLISRSNLSKTKNALAINVLADNNLGFFTSLPEDIESDKDKLVHEINFNYTLQYDKVVELLLEYQIYIHNQRIDKIYDKFFVGENHPQDRKQGNRTFTGFVNTATEKEGWYKVNFPDVFFDPIDRWHPFTVSTATSTMLMSPIRIAANDLRAIENINSFPDAKFPALVKTIMMEIYESVCTMYGSPFVLELFAVDDETRSIPITMDATGEIRSTIDLDLRKRHYLRLSLLLDLRLLPIEMLRFLCRHPDWVIYILQTINPKIAVDQLRLLGGGLMVDYESLWKLLNSAPPLNDGRIPMGSFNNANLSSFNSNLFGYYIEHNVATATVTVGDNNASI